MSDRIPSLGFVKMDTLSLCLVPEKISGYTLTVQASDNGSPPRVNTTTVNIDVSDVNDNAPVFAQGNYSVIIQVPRALRAHCTRPF